MRHTAVVIDPVIAGTLVALAVLYLAGLVSMKLGSVTYARIRGRRSAFFAAIAVTAATLLSPLDAAGARLFSAHMAQHLLLIILAAPLFALSDAPAVIGVLVPAAMRRWMRAEAAGTRMHGAEAAWAAAAAFVLTVWLWHLPAAHDWALAYEPAHAAEHLMVLASATVFWRVIVAGAYRRAHPAMVALIMSLVGLAGALLSALIMFAPTQLCRAYVGNPMEDQVLAGLLMCIPASFVYLASTVWALWRMLEGDVGRRPNAGG